MHTSFAFASTRVIALVLGATVLAGGKAAADQVIPDDLIVQGSTCVGLDCVNNELFGFDTLRLKENNTRIKFDDTSTSPGFPADDWQLTANDLPSGGLNKFSIENVTRSQIPFTVVGGAPTDLVFVASNGKVGLRTSTPVLDVHVSTSDTPAHRLEQTAAGGFSAQTWDIGANEANFFVRDVTGGSRLPFRVRPGAPTSSIDISASGSVGIGTASPAKLVHLNGNNTATMRLQDTSASSNIGELTVTSDFVGIGANRDNTTGTVFNAGKTTASVFLRATNADFAGVVLNHTDEQHQPDRADARRQGRQCRHWHIVAGGAAAHDRERAPCRGGELQRRHSEQRQRRSLLHRLVAPVQDHRRRPDARRGGDEHHGDAPAGRVL